MKRPWEDAGGGCNVAVPNLPRREVGWAGVYWRAPSRVCKNILEMGDYYIGAAARIFPMLGRDYRTFKNTTPNNIGPCGIPYDLFWLGKRNALWDDNAGVAGHRETTTCGLQLTTSLQLPQTWHKGHERQRSWTPTTFAPPAGLSWAAIVASDDVGGKQHRNAAAAAAAAAATSVWLIPRALANAATPAVVRRGDRCAPPCRGVCANALHCGEWCRQAALAVCVCVCACVCVCVCEIYIYAHARSFSFTIENPDIPASDMVRGALHSCALKRSRSYGATSRMWWAHCTMSLLWLPRWRASSNAASPNLQCAQACLPSQVPNEKTSSSRGAQLTALTKHRSCAEILAGSVC